MTRILVYPEQLMGVGRQMMSTGETIIQIGRRLSGAVNTLDWESRARIGMEGDFAAARARAEELGQRLIGHGRRMIHIAERFERADGESAQDLAGIPWRNLESVGNAISGAVEEVVRLRQSAEIFEHIVEMVSAGVLASSLTAGSTYGGQVIFRGSRLLKDMAGVSPYLTHIRGVRIPAHMGREALKKGFGKGNILFEALSELPENWEEYGGNIPKVATGILVDTAIGIGVSALGAGLGAVAFGAIGGAILGPPGAVIGAKLGGILGGMAGGWVADELENIPVGKSDLDRVIVDKVDHALSPFVNNVAQLF